MIDPDWAAIRADFETGGTATRRLARRYGAPEATIRHRAKAEGWVRRVVPLNQRALASSARKSDLEPLDYLLALMRDETAPQDLRCDAAIKAAPYCHRKAGR